MKRLISQYVCFVAIIMSFMNCGPKVTSSIIKEVGINDYSLISTDTLKSLKDISYDTEKASSVLVYEINDEFPVDDIKMVRLGGVRYQDTGFTLDCDYRGLIRKSRLEAVKNGGNIVRVVGLKKPSSYGSSCYRIRVELFNFKGDVKTLAIYKLKKIWGW